MRKKAFTLIELLIVVAIIAILAAIAVPNFLEAQTRSKVSRVKADQRSMATALEAYAVDYNSYPYPKSPSVNGEALFFQYLYALTTPIAYISSTMIEDPFQPDHVRMDIYNPSISVPEDFVASHVYFNYQYADIFFWGTTTTNMHGKRAYALSSNGPDRIMAGWGWVPVTEKGGSPYPPAGVDPPWPNAVYDATNGTVSAGDIGRFGGEVELPQGFAQ